MHRFACCLLLTVAVGAGANSRSSDTFHTAAGVVRITPIHHASLMLEANGKVIQVDPFSEGDYTGIPKADLILITDIHPDHMDQKQVDALKKTDTVVIAPGAVCEQLQGTCTTVSNGETKPWANWNIEAVPMYNLKRGPAPGKFYHDKGRGNGYILTYGGTRFYIAGDTEGTPEMRALKHIDVAFVPMNLPYTMTPEEAAAAVRAFDPHVVYPYHYRNSDLSVFKHALEGSGIEVRIRNWY